MTCDNVYYTYNLYYGRSKYCSAGYDYYHATCCNYGWNNYGQWIFLVFLTLLVLICFCGGIRKRNQRAAMMAA